MKTAEEYAALAERDVIMAENLGGEYPQPKDAIKFCLMSAQVYATLAQAAATLEEKHGQYCRCFKCYKLARDGG